VSLGIVIKAPEGIVLAAESRITLTGQNPATNDRVQVSFDNATKLLSFAKGTSVRPVGVVTYGQAAIGQRTASSFVPEFETEIGDDDLTTEEFAHRLSDFFMKQWTAVVPDDYAGPPMTFVVGGLDRPQPYGRVFTVDIPRRPEPVEAAAGGNFGITFGGQDDVMTRLLMGYDKSVPDRIAKALALTPAKKQELIAAIASLQMPLPLAAMPLQDCVDLAVFFIRTTIAAQSLTVGIRGVGGPIDVATVTRNGGLEFIKRKKITVDDR
jgi:hypothetical protein